MDKLIRNIAENIQGEGEVDLTQDQLQNELLLIQHHLNDAKTGLKDGDISYVNNSLDDILEVVDRLSQSLRVDVKQELERIK